MPAKDLEKGSLPRESSRFSKLWKAFKDPFSRGRSSEAAAPEDQIRKVEEGLTAEVQHEPNGASTQAAGLDAYFNSAETQNPTKDRYTDTENADACSKLWSVYVDEAERYDKRLVESWKGDMDGMLIFSGLYSASLTAFLIESYKTLQPDAGDITVNLLSQISRQLGAASIGNALPDMIPTMEPFQPTTAALVCNVLWFLSLALSLTCALLATLISQWARDFLHKTEMRPSPVRRARIFSFLYFGMKKFRMHTVVDIIPMILHASLFFFFAGLIAFLIPVNHMLAILMGSVLGVFLILYMVITALPLIYLDCPYHTPLSSALWNLWRTLRPWILAPGSFTFSAHSMTDAMVVESFRDTDHRDERALEWTPASLTDDTELLPFVDAIPDALDGPKGFHSANNHLFLPILTTPDTHLSIGTRITNLLQSTESLSLEDTSRIRRQNACLKAICALGMTAGRHSPDTRGLRPSSTFWFDKSLLHVLRSETLVKHYSASALAAVRYSRMLNLKPLLEDLVGDLQGCITASEVFQVRDRLFELVVDENMSSFNIPVPSFLRRLVGNTEGAGLDLDEYEPWSRYGIDLIYREDPPSRSSGILTIPFQGMKQLILDLNTDSSWALSQMQILAPFLSACLSAESCLYGFDSICEALMPHVNAPYAPSWSHIGTDTSLGDISIPHGPEIEDLDKIIRMFICLYSYHDALRVHSFLVTRHDSGVVEIDGFMWKVHKYIADRESDKAICYILDDRNHAYFQSTILQRLILKGVPLWSGRVAG